MADRSVKVVLNAQVQGYVDGMNKASQATKQVSAEGEKLTASSPSMQALGGVLLGVGTAVTAIGIAAYKTGIEYNTMQQTTRAALTTLLGSAEAANAQMDKLDEFARTSPFAKTTFIQAQQQMLAFGIETQKVIPYLDAVQNAVAAAGGSNDDIAGIVATMSKIQSSAKITAQDLIEFGNRGVNAAELIGLQMGKTGAQIREDISTGSLGATEALDALAKGMSQRFDGAADNVKQTFAGAMDRVKAAWRDFSSELAKPLVDPNGGGALVDLLNWAADMMRGFEKLPEPIKAVSTTLVFLGGAFALVTGAAILAVPKISEYRTAMEKLNSSGGKTVGVLGGIGRAFAGIAVAATAISLLSSFSEKITETDEAVNKLRRSLSSQDMFENAIGNVGAFSTTSAEAKKRLDDLADALDRASSANWFESINLTADKTLRAVGDVGETLGALAKTNLPAANAQFKRLAEEMDLTKEQQMQLLVEMGPYRDALIEQANAAGLATDDTTLLNLAMGDGSDAARKQSDALQEVSGAADDASGEISNLDEIIRNFGSATLDAREAEREFNQAILDATAAVAENGATLDITTEAGIRNQAALDAMARAANDSAAANYSVSGSEEQLRAQLDASREKLIAAAIQFGLTEDKARIYADQVLATPETVLTTANFEDTAARQRVQAWKNLVASIPGAVARGEYGSGLGVLLPGANGMMNTYANGGIQSFAGGGFPTGIYSGGTPIHKFAEPETRWEAYISGKSGQEARNRQIWVEAGRRLGMGAMSGSSDGNATSSLGRNPIVLNVYDVDNRLIGSMDARVAGALAPVSSGAVRDVMGVR
jgi:tape measure domain-containing protein